MRAAHRGPLRYLRGTFGTFSQCGPRLRRRWIRHPASCRMGYRPL